MQIPTRFVSKCEICGNELDTRQPGHYQFVSGWMPNRSAGGGNTVKMKKAENRWAHKTCISSADEGFL